MSSTSTSERSALRSALLGAASGLRSQAGVAAVIIGPESHRVPAVLRTRNAKFLVAALASGELLADKRPKAPDRTAPGALALRLLLGGSSAGLLARSEQEPPGLAASLGMLGALGGAFGGLALRRRLSARHHPVLVALAEDAAAAALAILAVTALAGRPDGGPREPAVPAP